ncbi:MAG: hypothetical protein U0Q11_11535 [Vicinamibacterales bacterium]
MEFIEAPVFTALHRRYMDDDVYRALQSHLAEAPEAGDVMPGTGGFRKLRWAEAGRGKGKRGGLRVIYYYFPDDDQVWLVTLYGKGEVADLNATEKRQLKTAISIEAAARALKRGRRR